MLNMVAGAVTAICAAQDRGGLHDALQAGIIDLDFDRYNLGYRNADTDQFIADATLTSCSAQHMKQYDSQGWQRRDPLIAHVAAQGQPLAWSVADWRGNSLYDDYFQYLNALGVRSGVIAPLESSPNTLCAITALSFTKSNFEADAAIAVHMLGQVAVTRAIALGLVEDGLSLGSPPSPALDGLSDLQREILEWVSRGKSNADIAIITNRSRRSIDYHLSQILAKLGVTTRSQAAALHAAS